MIHVLGGQLLDQVQKMLLQPGRGWQSRGRGWWRAQAAAGSQRLQGRVRRKLFALDFAPVFLLQRPGKTQRGVN